MISKRLKATNNPNNLKYRRLWTHSYVLLRILFMSTLCGASMHLLEIHCKWILKYQTFADKAMINAWDSHFLRSTKTDFDSSIQNFYKNAPSPTSQLRNLIIQSQLQLYRYLIHKSFENAFWICRISTRLGWIIHEHKVKNSNTHPIFDSWFTEKDPASRHSKNKLFCNLSYLKGISYREFS